MTECVSVRVLRFIFASANASEEGLRIDAMEMEIHAYPFPCVNVGNIHQGVVVGQRNRFHFIHNFDAEFMRINSEFMYNELFQQRDSEYGGCLQILWRLECRVDKLVGFRRLRFGRRLGKRQSGEWADPLVQIAANGKL